MLTTLVLMTLPGGVVAEGDGGVRFAPPVPISPAAAAKIESILYPTPVLHDVDGDGALEMVIGDLPGNLWVCEKAEGGPMEWSEPKALEGPDGPLKFDNW